MKTCNVVRSLITALAVVLSLGAEARLADVRNRKNPVSRAAKTSGIYQHDRFGFLSPIGTGDPSVAEFGINVYEAEEDQDIQAVGFYTLFPQSDYCICLVTNIVNGIVDVASATEDNEGTCAYAGYHTVKLNQAVRVRSGEKFGVYVELKSPNGDGRPMAV